MDADPAGDSILFDLLLLVFFTLLNAFFAGRRWLLYRLIKTGYGLWQKKEIRKRR